MRALIVLCLLTLLVACAPGPRAVPAPAMATVGATPSEAPTATLRAAPTAASSATVSAAPTGSQVPAALPVYGYRVVQQYPHDPDAFTQGLIVVGGVLYEGTGLLGRSSLRRVALESGEVQQQHDLPPEYFGEGIALFGDRLYQLTWQSHIGLIYDRESFESLGSWDYLTEGWGLTDDGARLIMSDGSATLRFLDPETLEETGSVQVTAQGQPVVWLNELEWVRGEVWANVWQTERIARIDPQTGAVVGWVDLTGLLDRGTLQRPVDVLNGIAYDEEGDRLFVTGKWWPTLFEIEVVAR